MEILYIAVILQLGMALFHQFVEKDLEKSKIDLLWAICFAILSLGT